MQKSFVAPWPTMRTVPSPECPTAANTRCSASLCRANADWCPSGNAGNGEPSSLASSDAVTCGRSAPAVRVSYARCGSGSLAKCPPSANRYSPRQRSICSCSPFALASGAAVCIALSHGDTKMASMGSACSSSATCCACLSPVGVS